MSNALRYRLAPLILLLQEQTTTTERVTTMEDYKVKKANRDRKVQVRRAAMPVNGLGYVRLITNVLGAKAVKAGKSK